MKFNLLKRKKAQLLNYEGAKAFSVSKEVELYAAVVTASLSDSFYEKENDRLKRIQGLIKINDPMFVAKLAVYTREKMYLRSVPLVLAVELAKINRGDGLVSKLVSRVVQRPDELTELLAYYEQANERKDLKKLNSLSKQIQKGLASAFNKFDEYQFAKYNREGNISLRDALFIVHPNAKNEMQQELFDKIANKNLSVPFTWETELSALGQVKFNSIEEKKLAKKEKWEQLIASGKMGYMALLRNLRNIIEANVNGEYIDKLYALLSDKIAVAKSKQLPFRFLSAYRELKTISSGHVSRMLDMLEVAVKSSVENMKGFNSNEQVLIACDVSSSMIKSVSEKSSIRLFDISLLLGMLLQSKCKNVQSGMFGDTWKIINMPKNNVLSNVDEFYKREGEVGYSTNGYLVIKDLLRRKVIMDKIMIFTDCQLWDSKSKNYNSAEHISNYWNKYKLIAPNAKLYLFDLAGYGNVPIKMEIGDVFLIAGWSDKIFDVLEAIENGSGAVEIINAIEI